jgi:hypothetical protein
MPTKSGTFFLFLGFFFPRKQFPLPHLLFAAMTHAPPPVPGAEPEQAWPPRHFDDIWAHYGVRPTHDMDRPLPDECRAYVAAHGQAMVADAANPHLWYNAFPPQPDRAAVSNVLSTSLPQTEQGALRVPSKRAQQLLSRALRTTPNGRLQLSATGRFVDFSACLPSAGVWMPVGNGMVSAALLAAPLLTAETPIAEMTSASPGRVAHTMAAFPGTTATAVPVPGSESVSEALSAAASATAMDTDQDASTQPPVPLDEVSTQPFNPSDSEGGEGGGDEEFSVLAQETAAAESEPELVQPPAPFEEDMKVTREQCENAILSLLGAPGLALCSQGDRKAGADFLQETYKACTAALDILAASPLSALADIADQILAKHLLFAVDTQMPPLCAPIFVQPSTWHKQVAVPVYSSLLFTELPASDTTLIWVLPFDPVEQKALPNASWQWYVVTEQVARILLALDNVAWLGQRLEHRAQDPAIVKQLGALWASTVKQYCTVLGPELLKTQEGVNAHLTPEALQRAIEPFCKEQ